MTALRRIGLDFDNTIITYDDVFLTMARERGLIPRDFSGRKQAIRDSIRLLPDGELAWQQLQGHVYGKGVTRAAMFDGVEAFLRRCKQENVPVVIVSHKTEFGHHDPERVNLRQAALEWMTAQGFFREGGYAIPPENVYFEGTRQEKIARITQLGCSHFIDDLEEVLTDPGFPDEVERILFSEGDASSRVEAYVVCPTWQDIEKRVFRDRK
jgi:hypothetical protein